MAFLSVLLGVGVDYFIDYLFLPARRNKPMFGPFDNTINSKVLCFAFGLVAEIERNLISMRTKEALALRKAEGVILGRKKGSITKLKILIDNELEIIDRLKKGESMASICRIYGVSTDTFSKFRKVCPSVEEAFQYKMTHFYTSSK